MNLNLRRYAVLLSILSMLLAAALPGGAQAPGAAEWEDEEYLRQEGLSMINAAEAYALGFTGRGVVVGVFDTGIDGGHWEFQGHLTEGFYPGPPGVLFPPEESRDFTFHGSHVGGLSPPVGTE